jgi:hypothetical protein
LPDLLVENPGKALDFASLQDFKSASFALSYRFEGCFSEIQPGNFSAQTSTLVPLPTTFH